MHSATRGLTSQAHEPHCPTTLSYESASRKNQQQQTQSSGRQSGGQVPVHIYTPPLPTSQKSLESQLVPLGGKSQLAVETVTQNVHKDGSRPPDGHNRTRGRNNNNKKVRHLESTEKPNTSTIDNSDTRQQLQSSGHRRRPGGPELHGSLFWSQGRVKEPHDSKFTDVVLQVKSTPRA